MVNYTGIDYPEITRQVDSSLEFMAQLGVTARAVCKVKKEGQVYVLKAFNVNYWGTPKKMAFERQVLARVGEFECMTHLIRDYGRVGDYEAILKEYFEGVSLQSVGISQEISLQLEDLVHQLHLAGMVCVRFGADDVIISPKGIARLIELDSCHFREEKSPPEFEYGVKSDLEWIRNLSKPSDLRVPGQYDP